MLSLQFIREHPDLVKHGAVQKGDFAPVDEIVRLDSERRDLLQQVESLRATRNDVSKQLSRMREKPATLIEEMRAVGDEIKALDVRLAEIEPLLQDLLLRVPNIPAPDVPIGKDESENVVLRHWGDRPRFDFAPKPHWEIGERLGIIDFERGVKIAGPRFYVLSALGCRLERALIDWMLDLHTSQHGYVEVSTPYLVKREAMVGTGNLPKFEEDLYRCDADDLFLIPTAEVPVTNLFREETLDPGSLPIYRACYSACFRREAGAAGRDTRGIIRVHQFNKVELVKLVSPETSYRELDLLRDNAESVLRLLNIAYRVTQMCTGDLGFSAAKKYDLEAWLPGQDRYVEISSCSNFEAFQARRANIRYRPAVGARPDFVHTINGSGLAVGRTMAAILENYQRADGSVEVPEILRPYMRVDEIR